MCSYLAETVACRFFVLLLLLLLLLFTEILLSAGGNSPYPSTDKIGRFHPVTGHEGP